LNQEISALLVARGQVEKQGREHQILVPRDLTPAQITWSGSYQEGDVVQLRGTRPQQRQGINKNSCLTVEAVNRGANSLTLRTAAGQRLEVSPAKWANAAEVYTREDRTLAVGDRLQFRTLGKKRNIAKQFATVINFNGDRANLQLDGTSKRELTIPLSQLRHVDYGYASTSHAAQGATVDRVIVNADSVRSARLVNRKQFYVSISRARLDACVYTDDAKALRQAVGRESKKEIALDAVKQWPTPQLKPT
jgi:hypothetical protein